MDQIEKLCGLTQEICALLYAMKSRLNLPHISVLFSLLYDDYYWYLFTV